MTLVALEEAWFRHPLADRPVWQDVNLEVARGDRLLVVGASGAGKSTLLGVMTGLVPRLSAGKLGGRVRLNYARAGLVLQNPEAQLVTPTVFEEVAFALENRSWPTALIRERVAAVLERLGLGPLAWRATATLSGGEAQRLSLACALAQDPEIFFMDEPTAYLDPWAAASFFLGLKEVLAESTLVLVEHRTAEARGLVSRAVVLEKYAGLTELPPHSASCPSEVIGDGELWDGTAIEGRPLRIEALSHRYPGAGPVWSGLTAEFRPGRISGIMGPSGSGKSTLLKKLAGLLPSPRTTLFWGEEDLTRLSPRKLYSQLLYLPQNPEHFFFCMSVAQEWLSTGATPAQIEKAARLFGLDPRSPLHPGTLSEGEKRRLTLALAFLDPRPILLLDEPTYGLDQQSFSTLARGLKALRNQGRTVVLVTHSPELVRACVDDLWLLSEGGWSSISVDSLERLLPEASLV